MIKSNLEIALSDAPQVNEEVLLIGGGMPLQEFPEMGRASGKNDPVSSDFGVFGSQGDVEKVCVRSQVLEGQRDVGRVVVPSQAIFLGCAHFVAVDDVKR